MAQWVNFAEIRSRVSLEDILLRYYKIENLKRDGPKLVGPCPVHNGDSPRAFHADLDKNVWHCFSRCQKGGNQLDLVAARENISVRDAALKLQAFFLTAPPSPPPPAPAAIKKEAPVPAASAPGKEEGEGDAAVANPPLDFKLDLKSDHPHLLQDRGLQLETALRFGIGYCSRGILRGTIAIPIHDEDGDLVAYAGRRLKTADVKEHGKYKLPKGFKKERVLFNYDRAKAHKEEFGLVLVEGFFSVVKLHEAGFPNAVASMGCAVSDVQAELLATAKDVTVIFDGDEAGRAGADAAAKLLGHRVPVHVIRLPEGTEPDDLPPKMLRWLVNGARVLDLAEVAFVPRPTPVKG